MIPGFRKVRATGDLDKSFVFCFFSWNEYERMIKVSFEMDERVGSGNSEFPMETPLFNGALI